MRHDDMLRLGIAYPDRNRFEEQRQFILKLAEQYQIMIDDADEYIGAADDLTPEIVAAYQQDFERRLKALYDTSGKDLRELIKSIAGDEAADWDKRVKHRLPRELAAGFLQTNPGAVAAMVEWTDPDSALYQKWIETLPKIVADRVAQELRMGQGLGMNPLTVAKRLHDVLGMALTWSETTARTAMLYASRDADWQQRQLNNKHLTGWIWYAELDDKTCLPCILMHGTVHRVDERLNDHYRGRCTTLDIAKRPKWLTADVWPEENIETGQEWFRRQSVEKQEKILGPATFRLWTERKWSINPDYNTKTVKDEVFGRMIARRSLKELGWTRDKLNTVSIIKSTGTLKEQTDADGVLRWLAVRIRRPEQGPESMRKYTGWGDIPLYVAKAFAQRLADLSRQYPIQMDSLEGVAVRPQWKEGTYAHYEPGKRLIAINRDMFKDAPTIREHDQRDFDGHWVAARGPAAAITHEFGHHVDLWTYAYRNWWAKENITKESDMHFALELHGLNRDPNLPSGYSRSEPVEYFAESFSAGWAALHRGRLSNRSPNARMEFIRRYKEQQRLLALINRDYPAGFDGYKDLLLKSELLRDGLRPDQITREGLRKMAETFGSRKRGPLTWKQHLWEMSYWP